MTKILASTGFLCPGCSANFDTEIHVPFMGSCGDSICAVCLTEKKIKSCPECHLEGAFTCSQKNNLAMKFLSAAAEKEATDSKNAKLDLGEEMDEEMEMDEEPVPAILDPNNRHFLAQIVNQLNPASFLHLASTCKTLHNYCFNSQDVKITYDIRSIAVKMDDGVFKYGITHLRATDFMMHIKEDGTFCTRFLPLSYSGYDILSSAAGRKKLREYPFEFRLGELVLHDVDRFDLAFFTPLRALLAEFPIKTISSVVGADGLEDAIVVEVPEAFMQLVKDFRIMHVKVEYADFNEGINEELINYMLQNTASFEVFSMEIPERLLLNAYVPRLHLNISISSKTFVDLLKKFADSTDEIDWHLFCEPFELHLDALHSFKLLPFDYEGALPDEHPIVFVKEDQPGEYWLLRRDRKVLKSRRYNSVAFFMCPPREYPPCLRRGVDDSDVDD